MATIPGIGSAVSAQASTNNAVAQSLTSSMDVNSFMRMFLAQMKYQDPTNPMESYELAAQLAQFSMVGQLTQANTLLGNLQGYVSGINNAEIASMVGKNVTAQRNTIDVKTDSVTTLDYKLDTASDVTVTIRNAKGDVVHTENRTAQEAGNYNVAWDGKDSSGTRVTAGPYTCEVQATDALGNVSIVTTTVNGQIYSCNLDSTTPTYTLTGPDGITIPVSDVSGFNS